MHLLSPENLINARLGAHDYDIVVGLMTRFQPYVIVHQLALHYPQDFEGAAAHLDQVAYQTLRASGPFSIFSLVDPLLDAGEEICLHLENADTIDCLKADLIADAIDVDATVASITAVLQSMSADEAKAVWASVVFGQTAPLHDHERLIAPWWTTAFIRQWGTETL
jgi:hypothetical protein